MNVLKRKKNIILAGAPGVGKTFMAKRLVYSLLGKKDDKTKLESNLPRNELKTFQWL